MTKRKGRTFVDGKVHVRKRKCASCIYGPKSPVAAERRQQMQDDSDRDGGCIPCHSHLYVGERVHPICRGYFDNGNSIPVRLAAAMEMIEWHDGEPKRTKRA